MTTTLTNRPYNNYTNKCSVTGGYDLGQLYFSDHILEGDEAVGKALLGTYVYKDGIAGIRNGYPEFYDKYLALMKASEAQQVTLGDNTITMYINANGLQFYNIADKEVIDAWYNKYGKAYFFGVDEENERIFLPRGEQYLVMGKNNTVPVKVFGTGKTLGLTNGTNNVALSGISVDGPPCTLTTPGFNVNVANTPTSPSGRNSKGYYGVVTNPSTSGIRGTVDLSNIGQKAYLYMVVGNTKEVTHIRTTIPEGEALEQIYKNKDDITILNDNKVDLTNTQWAINSCALDYKNAISLMLTTTPYTAPIDGVIFVADNNTSTKNQLIIDGVSLGAVKLYLSIAMRVSKGSTIATVADIHAQFIPLKGAV